jgi:NAD(P)-dependent dehydrogenase (short-subunit alcohol dehydrogenase family)
MVPPVILVTAGSAGLGAAAARLFAKSGYRVVINFSSNESRAQALREELELLSPPHKPPTAEQLGNPGSLRADPEVFGTHITLRADLTKRNEIVELVKDTMDWLGRLDVVFSNGGWTAMRNFSDLDDNVDEEDWDKCFNMNVKSHLWLMHAARPYLDESEGAFITTASLAGVRPSGSSLVCFSLFVKVRVIS